jgi:NitT/TauT family transport system ATP-binding protein
MIDATSMLEIEHVALQYASDRTNTVHVAISDVSLRVPNGSFTVIVGPSGCGKSSLLKAIAGLLPCSSGRLSINGREVRGPGSDRAVVFQSPALLPWRDVLGNVMYGLELHRVPRDLAIERASTMIELVGLSGNNNRFPHELSGGMKQRVNLARALALDPKLILLDEPFSALDSQTRENMQYELLRIWQETGKTVLFITHDIGEAVFLADQVAVLSAGPGSILMDTVSIPLARPRADATKRAPQFFALVDKISSMIAVSVQSRRSVELTSQNR